MPLGSFRINGLAKFRVTTVAQIIRRKKGITAVGNAQIDTAQSQFGGSSALFDGTGDYLIGYDNLITGTGDFTIELWIRFNSTTTAIIYDQRTASSGNFSQNSPVLFWENSTAIYYNGGNRIISSTLSTGVWYHWAVSRSSGSTRMFINGSQVGSTFSDTIDNPSTGNFGIGVNLPNLGNTVNGWIDEVRISNIARYTANFTSPTAPFTNDDNTLLLLHMDGTDASTYFEDDNGVRARRGILANGNAQITTAQSQFGGSSLLLDGTGDYLAVSADSTDFGTGDFTIEGWVRFNSTSGTRVFYDRREIGPGNPNGILLYWSGSTFIYHGNTATRISGGTATTGVWYHWAVSRSSGSTRMFINGSQVGSTFSDTQNYNVTQTNYVGASVFLDSTWWNGWIDEVRVSNTGRYTANFTSSTTPFVNDSNTRLLLHMNGTNASTVFVDDNGSRSQKGIIAIGNAQIDTTQSKFGGASAQFDGTGDYLNITNFSDITNWYSSATTVELWVRLNTMTSLQASPGGTPIPNMIGNLNPTGSGNYWSFGPLNNGTVRFFYYNGAEVTVTTTGVTLTTGVWYHLAMVQSGSTIKIYVDGTERASASISGTPQSGTAIAFTIGQYNGTCANAWVDEVRISNNARYTANFTPSTTPFQNDVNTLLLLHMDGTDASTVFVDDNGKTPT